MQETGKSLEECSTGMFLFKPIERVDTQVAVRIVRVIRDKTKDCSKMMNAWIWLTLTTASFGVPHKLTYDCGKDAGKVAAGRANHENTARVGNAIEVRILAWWRAVRFGMTSKGTRRNAYQMVWAGKSRRVIRSDSDHSLTHSIHLLNPKSQVETEVNRNR